MSGESADKILACSTCLKPITKHSKTGLCQPCAANKTGLRAVRSLLTSHTRAVRCGAASKANRVAKAGMSRLLDRFLGAKA